MAKFRTNHARQGTGKSGGMIVRVGLFSAILGGLYLLFDMFSGPAPATDTPADEPIYAGEAYYLPDAAGKDLEVIRQGTFALGYNEQHEQAEWVAYVLEGPKLDQPWNERPDEFHPDAAVSTGTATPDDYRDSGYDRGHLVPAADRSYDAAALAETFLMSNISPQAPQFNQGIWRELEETVREWAKKDRQLYVVSGPVLTQKPKGAIGRDNRISVPAAYYKVLLDLTEPEQKAIGFIIPNQVSFEPLYEYAVSVDEVEELTRIDFFADLMPDDLETELEAAGNIDLWHFDRKKFERRVNEWNQ